MTDESSASTPASSLTAALAQPGALWAVVGWVVDVAFVERQRAEDIFDWPGGPEPITDPASASRVLAILRRQEDYAIAASDMGVGGAGRALPHYAPVIALVRRAIEADAGADPGLLDEIASTYLFSGAERTAALVAVRRALAGGSDPGALSDDPGLA